MCIESKARKLAGLPSHFTSVGLRLPMIRGNSTNPFKHGPHQHDAEAMTSSYNTVNPPAAATVAEVDDRTNGCTTRSKDTSPQLPEDGETTYPEGGRRAWLTLLGCFCGFFAALSLTNSIGVYQSWISDNQLKGTSPGKIGWIFGFYNFFSFFVGLPLGPMFDAKGPKALAFCGALMLVTTYLLLGQCREYWHFFLCFGLAGSLSTGLLFTAAIGTVQHWFFRRRGLATGLAICGGSVGGITSPLALGALLPRVGFTWTMRTMALVMVPFLIIAFVLMKSRLHSTKGTRASILPDLRVILRRDLSVLAVGVIFIELGLFIPMTFVASYAIAQGFSTQAAYRIVTLMNVGSFLGRLLPGWIGDRLGRFNAQIVALLLCLVSILAVWRPAGHTLPGLTAFTFLFGLGSGSGISLVPVCIGQLCKTEEYGRTFTVIYSVGSFG